MEHDRQMALKQEAEKATARKKLSEAQRGALHVQMQEREVLKREVRAGPTESTVLAMILTSSHRCRYLITLSSGMRSSSYNSSPV